jgi:hypothetical protein
MGLSPEQREKMLASTREAAAAFLDDIDHFRQIVARLDPSPGELRRISGMLRRLLVERDISIIAAPRLGRFMFRAPDNKPIDMAGRKIPYPFFASGGAAMFGAYMRAAIVDRGPNRREILNLDPDKTVDLRLDGFLAQHVLCLEGRWVSRGDVIKFMANVASGVHSGTPESSGDAAIARIRRSVSYYTADDRIKINFDIGALFNADPPFRYSPSAIDPVLFELLAAIHYLLLSPDTAKLEAVVSAELR